MTPTVVCLTPVWNEAWILERFLDLAARWADRIVVADQSSDDGSREIAARHPKVILVDNDSSAYDEGARQRLLLAAARELPAPRVLVALDADEALTAGAWETTAWREALASPPGTVIRMPWINLQPGLERAWIPPEPIVFGFIDDGSEHAGLPIHSTRLPVGDDSPVRDLDGIAVLHLQYLDPARMRAKQRWYQCFERVEHPEMRPAEIYRQYHRMDSWPEVQMHDVEPGWIDGLGLAAVGREPGGADPWHRRILELMRDHGASPFRRLDIWDVDWQEESARLGVAAPDASPGLANRLALRWLRYAQPRRGSVAVRAVSRALAVAGW